MNTSQSDMNQKSKSRKAGDMKKNENQKQDYLGVKKEVKTKQKNGAYTIINK